MPRYKDKPSDVFVDRRNAKNILDIDLSDPRRRSVVSPIELAPKATAPGVKLDPKLKHVIDQIISNAVQGDIYDKAAYLMFYNSLRVSELLSIQCNEISSDGTFKIHASKGSMNRIGRPGLLLSWLLKFRGLGRYLFDCHNRRDLYYQFRKRGYRYRVSEGEKGSVTHLMRHLSIKQLKAEGYEQEVIQTAAGHRSAKSTEWYTG